MSSHWAHTSSMQATGRDVERQQRLSRLPGIGRVRGRVAVHLQRRGELAPVDVVGRREPFEEHLIGAVVMVAQRAGDLRELRHIARLEQRVTGVRGERAEHVRPHHRHDHRAVAAGRLAGQRARFAVGQRRIALLDERDDLVAQVVLIAAEPERVQELRTAVGRPAVDERDQRVRAVAGGEHRVDPLDHRELERGAVEPHVDLARVALDDVDDGQRSRVVELDPGRAVDVQRPACRIAQRIVRQELGFDDETVERAVHRPLPRRARRTFNFAQCH